MSRRVLLLAHPAGHSLSPAMHNAALAALGIDVLYQALDVPPEALREAVADLRKPDVVGANVTIPHKRAVMRWLDRLEGSAAEAGAVNTVVRERALGADRLVGANTDGEGFLRALAELGVAPAGASCVVLGAGGAARAVTRALLGAGAQVAVHNRTVARARALAADMAPAEAAGGGEVRVLEGAELAEAIAGAALLVQATPVGMMGTVSGDVSEGAAGAADGASPLPTGMLPRAGAVVDLVYRPAETPLLAAARERGLLTQNGLPMLVHQGALAFERWFGKSPPIEVMRKAALAELG